MKSSDKRILLILGCLVAVGALWFGLISPKRAELSELDGQVSEKQAAVSELEANAMTAAAAKESYNADYRELITLGKAVPADDDASSLIDQIDGLAAKAGVEFIGLELQQGGGGDTAPPPEDTATTGTTEAPAASGDAAASESATTGGDAATPAPTTPVPATETAAADLPLGATVGAAGLPVMPYEFTFRGTFFQVADFLESLDGMVKTGASGITVAGRLLTVDGFALRPDEDQGFPQLSVSLNVTTYVAPADQGLTGGATPATPAPGAATPATTPPATPAPATPTAAVTP